MITKDYTTDWDNDSTELEIEVINEFLNEECSCCHEQFTDIHSVFVDVDTDNYVCERCSLKYGLEVVLCLESLGF